MTSVIELSTSIGSCSPMHHTAPATDAPLESIEADMLAKYAARNLVPFDCHLVHHSMEHKTRICQEESAAALARTAQVKRLVHAPH